MGLDDDSGNNALRIEAEDFVDMNGIQTEPCSEGGENVGYTDPGDRMAYPRLVFPITGRYLIEYRVASAVDGSGFSTDLNAGEIILGGINVPNTGGWQNWTTVSHVVNIDAGTYPLGIFTNGGGYNLNWFEISVASESANLLPRTEPLESIEVAAATATDVVLYPNPATNTIGLTGLDSEEVNTIFDTQGRRVLETTEKEDIDISSSAPGLYIARTPGRETISFSKGR